MSVHEFLDATESLPNTEKMPALFIGHGSPMNGIEDNSYSRGWEALGQSLPRPKAILSISAHWYTEGTFVHVGEKPMTIHDYWGFPEASYQVEYRAPGAPTLARTIKTLITNTEVHEDSDWGLDHGTWTVLHRMYPEADVPVFQLSIDLSKPPSFHYELGAQLLALRAKGVLIMGSGNLVHNLGHVNFHPDAKRFDWAEEFDILASKLILKGDHQPLIAYDTLGHAAALSIPTPDHYLPLLYILGLQGTDDEVSFPIEGIAHGSISMRSVLVTEHT